MIDLAKILRISGVNLLRQVRDRGDLFFVFVLPTIIIIALGLQFGGQSRARLGVLAPAGDAAAAAIVADLESQPTRFEVRHIADEATIRSQVEHGLLEAGLVIPDGFEASLEAGRTGQIEFLGTPGSLTSGLRVPIDASVAKIAAIMTATRAAVGQGAGSWDAARTAAEQGYDGVPGVKVEVTQVGAPGLYAGFSTFTFGASTQLILFMFLTSMTGATSLVRTRQLGVARRMLSTPTSTWTIVVGETGGRFAIAMLQALYIVAISALLFGVSWGDPLATGALVALFGLVAAAAAMLVGAMSRNASQAGSLGVFVGLSLGALGGCMIPYQTMPESMQAIARLVPHSWALLGIQAVIRDGGGLATAAPNLAVLAVYAAVLLVLAGWRYRKAITD